MGWVRVLEQAHRAASVQLVASVRFVERVLEQAHRAASAQLVALVRKRAQLVA